MSSLPRIIVKHPASLMPGELIQKTTAESLCKAVSQHYCPCLLNDRKVTCLFTFNLDVQTSPLSLPSDPPASPRDCEFFVLVNLAATYESDRRWRGALGLGPGRCNLPRSKVIGLLLILLEKSLFLFASGEFVAKSEYLGF